MLKTKHDYDEFLATTGKNMVLDAFYNVSNSAMNRSLSATGLENWAKKITLNLASKTGDEKKEVRANFHSTFTVSSSIRELANVFMTALNLVEHAGVGVRVLLYNFINIQFHWFLRRGYTIQAFLLSTAFAFAASHFHGMYKTWVRLRQKKTGKISNMDYIAMILQVDKVTLTKWLLKSTGGRYALAYDLLRIWKLSEDGFFVNKSKNALDEIETVLKMMTTQEEYLNVVSMLEALKSLVEMYEPTNSGNFKRDVEKKRTEALELSESDDVPSEKEKKLGLDFEIRVPVKISKIYLPVPSDDRILINQFKDGIVKWPVKSFADQLR